VEAVDVPDAVIELLTGLRDYLQDKCEPPVYVSDRRFMKSINMLQVAAFADGRSKVRLRYFPTNFFLDVHTQIPTRCVLWR